MPNKDKHDDVLTMPLDELKKRVDKVTALLAQAEELLPGLITLTHEDRRTTTGRFRSGEAAALRAELDVVAERGWAENVEESHVGVASVGAPIRGANGEVLASVSVVGATTRMTAPTRRSLVDQVVAAAALISQRLGHRPPR